MKTRWVLIAVIFLLCACNSKAKREQNRKGAIALSSEAMGLVPFIDNGDSLSKALELLDKATTLDSNYLPAYDNKLVFYTARKEYGKAIATAKTVTRLDPTESRFLTTGILYEAAQDSVSARPYFERSLSLCNAILDTMQRQNPNRVTIASHKAANLLMLGDPVQSRAVLKQLFDAEKDPQMKNIITNFAQKDKAGLVKEWIGN